MKDLLTYYKRELTELQRLGESFAKKHPKIAAQLGINDHVIKDPNISRLVESVALMNARINYKLDDDFSEISEALLSILFPNYLAPIPALSIMQFDVMPDVEATVMLPRDTAIEALLPDSTIARFKTCYPVELSPISVTAATLMGHLHSAPPLHSVKHAESVLKISLQCLDKNKNMADLNLKKIRFFLNGSSQHTYPLYELLFNHVESIRVGNTTLSKTALKPVGFEPLDTVLPYDSRTPLSYHLLNDFFVFPEKFLFFDLTMPTLSDITTVNSTLDIYFYLHQSPLELQKHITANTFALHCSPIINLFKKTIEPVALTHTESSYLLTPDVREPDTLEIYSLDHIWATPSSDETNTYLPFYGLHHYGETAKHEAYWYAQRKCVETSQDEQDMTLSIVDLNFKPDASPNQVLNIEATCFNRLLDNSVLMDPEKTYYQLSEGSAPISTLHCLIPFTPVLRRPLRDGARWQVISHLSAQHIGLANPSGDISGLKEILSLYNFPQSEMGKVMIDSLISLQTKRTLTQMTLQNIASFVHGIEVRIELDKTTFSDSSVFLFASVLEKFATLYASLNSFVQLIIVNKGNQEILYKGSPYLGQRGVL